MKLSKLIISQVTLWKKKTQPKYIPFLNGKKKYLQEMTYKKEKSVENMDLLVILSRNSCLFLPEVTNTTLSQSGENSRRKY